MIPVNYGAGAETRNHAYQQNGWIERRSSIRFPITEEIRYRVLDRRGKETDGTGVTVDMGRGGVLFTTSIPPGLGRLVEVSVSWPVALDGICPLKLVAVGRVVRTSSSMAAVRIERYQFKTRGRAAGIAGVAAC